MTNRTFTQIEGEAVSLPGVAASPLPAASGSNVIPFRKATSAAFVGFEDGEADYCFEQVGLVAVRMLARWSLPRIVVKMGDPETVEEAPPGL